MKELQQSGQQISIPPTFLSNENPKELIEHVVQAAKLMVEKAYPGFSEQFMNLETLDELYKITYLEAHRRLVEQYYLIDV